MGAELRQANREVQNEAGRWGESKHAQSSRPGGKIQNRAGRWGESQNAPGQNSVGESAIFDLKTAGTSVKIPLQTLPNGPVVERRGPELTPTALTVTGSFFFGQNTLDPETEGE